MAKETYYAIDPISSAAIVLNDKTGTPPTQVLAFTSRGSNERLTGTYVGCNTSFTYQRDKSEMILKVLLQIRSHSMEEVYDKLEDLKDALKGDVRIPGGTKLFNFRVAVSSGTYYGYEKCSWIGFRPNWRAQYTYDDEEYILVKPPVFTLVDIIMKTAWTDLTELD